MHFITLLITGFVLVSAASRSEKSRGTRWWALGQEFQLPKSNFETSDIKQLPSDMYNANSVNPTLSLLTKKQKRTVTRNPGSIVAVAKGAKMAISECQHQFRNRRWNCPTSDTSHGGPLFGNIVNIGCRESSFLYAITSAALVYSVARACSEGNMYTCSCDFRRDPPGSAKGEGTDNIGGDSGEEWTWGGCSDNVNFGYRFAKQFADVEEAGLDLRAITNKHNNEAGRKHIYAETAQQCKCHGTSGSCTLKTCWMRLPLFRHVGSLLKERFDGASKVYADNGGRSGGGRAKRSLSSGFVPIDASHKNPTALDLVYYDESPDFCTKNVRLGMVGTHGRQCNATSLDVDGCELMCCGRGYASEVHTVAERCNCTFHWCCDVQCKVCHKQRDRHICN